MKKILICLVIAISVLIALGFSKMVYAETEQEEVVENQEVQDQIEVKEIVEEVINQINGEKDFWQLLQEKVLTPETITLITLLLGVIGALLKCISSVKNLKIKNALTLENVENTLKESLQEQNKLELDRLVGEITSPLASEINGFKPVLEAFAKVLVLSQENTPNSKLAILELLSQMGRVDTQVVEKAKNEVIKQELEQQEKKEQVIEELKKIEMPVE